MEFWVWAMVVSGGIGAAIFLFRLWWTEHYQRPNTADRSCVRVRGRVVGPGRHGDVALCQRADGVDLLRHPLDIQTDTDVVRVISRGAVVQASGFRFKRQKVRMLQVGAPVTVDGVPATLPASQETYRQPGRLFALEAIRITQGRCPEVPWLRVPMMLSALVFLASLFQCLFFEQQKPPPTLATALGVAPTRPAAELERRGMHLNQTASLLGHLHPWGVVYLEPWERGVGPGQLVGFDGEWPTLTPPDHAEAHWPSLSDGPLDDQDEPLLARGRTQDATHHTPTGPPASILTLQNRSGSTSFH